MGYKMVNLKSATMFYNDKEIEMKRVEQESCVQLYFEILGSKFELDYFNVEAEAIAQQMDIEYDYVNDFYILKNYSYKLVFEIEVVIDGVTNYEELIINVKNENGELECKYTLMGIEVNSLDIDDGIDELYYLLEPNVHMKICGGCAYGSWNPEGGDQMTNYLCFEKLGEKVPRDMDKSGRMQILNRFEVDEIQGRCILDSCQSFRV